MVGDLGFDPLGPGTSVFNESMRLIRFLVVKHLDTRFGADEYINEVRFVAPFFSLIPSIHMVCVLDFIWHASHPLFIARLKQLVGRRCYICHYVEFKRFHSMIHIFK